MTTVVNKKDLDIESLQQSVSLLGQGMKTIQVNAENDDTRWSEVAVMFNGLTLRQDATTSAANQLVKDLANVLESMRGDQQSMMHIANENKRLSEQQQDGLQELGEAHQYQRRDLSGMEKMSNMFKKQIELLHAKHREEVGQLRLEMSNLQQKEEIKERSVSREECRRCTPKGAWRQWKSKHVSGSSRTKKTLSSRRRRIMVA